MAHTTDRTVLGDFSGATFDYHGVTSRFFRKDGKFFVETDGPDGKLATFEIKYTFGVDPLQQYLIEFPDGRIQALSIAWDSRPKDKGGQRWFHLYPNENIRHDDVLHWTKLNQNWNFMCAECHSTGVRKNYDAATDSSRRRGARSASAARPATEPDRDHVAWARNQQSWWPFGKREDRSKGLAVRFDERANVTWTANPQTGKPQRSIPTGGSCAPRWRLAASAMRGAAHSPRNGFRDVGCPIRIGCRHLTGGFFMPTADASRKPITINPSSRARCSQRA